MPEGHDCLPPYSDSAVRVRLSLIVFSEGEVISSPCLKSILALSNPRDSQSKYHNIIENCVIK